MENYTTKIYDNENDGFLLSVRKACDRYASLVAKTAGPKGHNVMLINNGQCHLTKDGISVLRSIAEVDNAADKTAIAILRGASEQTNRLAGDGTTATCILANEIFQKGFPLLTNGVNGNGIRKGIERAANLAVKFVKDNISTPVKDTEDIKRVARISSNGSEEIANILADTFGKIGKDGYARVELSNTTITSNKIVEGMTFRKGMESPYFATNEHGEAVLDNPVVLIVNKRLSVATELIKPFDILIGLNRPILLIADGYDEAIVNTLAVNKLRGVPICAISAPAWGEYKTAIMEDIAVACDGQVISPSTGSSNIETRMQEAGVIGHAKQVIVSKEETTIISDCNMNPAENKRLADRIALINSEIDDPKTSEHDRGIARTRKARLVGGIGIISVGGATEAEIHEKKDLVDDAFSSVKSALVDGIVPGAGVTFLCVQNALAHWLQDNGESLNSEELQGFGVFMESLNRPTIEIIANCSPNDTIERVTKLAAIISANETERSGDETIRAWTKGYDGNKDDIVDLVEAGIIDSAAAVISAIRNGSSAGGGLLTLAGSVYTPVKPQAPVIPQVAD